MENQSGIETDANTGEEGKPGDGGIGGKGGEYGYAAYATCSIKDSYFLGLIFAITNLKWCIDRYVKTYQFSTDGIDGKSGDSKTDIKDPEPAPIIQEVAITINKYKSYIRTDLSHNLKKNSLLNFYEQIDKNIFVKKVYDTLSFLSEFSDLENQFYELKKDTYLYPFYKSLLERIGDYSKCSGNCDSLGNRKIVLSYFYTAVLSRINFIAAGRETDLVIDIETYLDSIKTEIDKLRDIENVNNKVNTVQKLKNDYKKRFDEKIQEANYFIENTVDPEINRISNEIDNKIDLLIDETISLKKKALKEKKELENKRKGLFEALKLRKVFDFLKTLSRKCNSLGKYGRIIGTAIELGTSVGQFLTLGNEETPFEFPKTADKLKSIENNIKSMRIEKSEYISNVLDDLTKKVTQNPRELGSISGKVSEMKIRLDQIRTHQLKYKEISKFVSELKQILKTKEIDLKRQFSQNSQVVAKMIEMLYQTLEVGSASFEIYNKHKEDDEKIAVIFDAIDQKENELNILSEYEEHIYETIYPALQNMHTDLQIFASDLNNRSQVALDVGKWQIHKALKDIRTKMQRVTDGMDVKNDLDRCLENLEEAMSLLITIYDRIQQFQDEQNLSNHITNVCLIDPNTFTTTQHEVVNVTNHLEMSIRSSLVLKYYETALNAFKQWVFPFASHYLDESTNPSNFQPNGNLQDLALNAAKGIDHLKEKLKKYKASVKETDEILIHGEFNSQCASCKPFFVWKDEQYRNEISRLLSGQAVVFKADVKDSEIGKDAIKFNSITLYFKTKNVTQQSHLDETLKMFDVSATHSGNSYYRYDGKTYLITSPKRTIVYSIEENIRTGNPVRSNQVARKIKNGDLLLSPYNMWTFKLNATRKNLFHELNIYKGQIDLELDGKGSYVMSNFEDYDYESQSQLDTSVASEVNYRAVRSLRKYGESKKSLTSGSASILSSPINTVCILLKIYLISFITIPYNKIVNYGKRSMKITDINNRFRMKHLTLNEFHKKVASDLSEGLHGKGNESKSKLDSSLNDHKLKVADKFSKYNMDAIHYSKTKHYDYNNINADFNKRKIPNVQYETENKQFNTSFQVPELNYCLLLSDFITRLFTGVKYETEMDESLMSPKELIMKKCNELPVKNEDDIIKNFRLFSEMDNKSWFSSVKGGIKLLFEYLGFTRKEEMDDYIPDIRNLFDSE